MVLFYAKPKTSRIEFITHFLFQTILGIDYKIINDLNEFNPDLDILINYTNQRSQFKEIFIQPHGLLEQHGVEELNIKVMHDLEFPYFFQANHSDYHFDLFAASFYLVSRYEEYLNFRKDKHGRFEANQSLAFRENFLKIPIVDVWAIEFRKWMHIRYPNLNFRERNFHVQATFDIDQVFKIKGKSGLRIVKSLTKSIINFDFKDLAFKIAILLNKKQDPFDQYDRIERIHRSANIKAIYFILFSQKFNKYDINLSTKQVDFIQRIRKLTQSADIGIHPSYYSKSRTLIIESEKYYLSQIINRSINRSRQHYLKMRIPNTYKSLISAGIEHDFTMGYASQNGFRAGTCTPFPFFDLNHDQLSFLTVHPFCLMDATFTSYLNVTPQEALKEIENLIKEVRKVNGQFTPLWHNESMSGYKEWKGWEDVYEKMIELTK